MNRFYAATALCFALTAPALADGKIYVQLPDLSSYQGQEAEDFLHEVVLANVVSSNCTGAEISDEEWSLLTDSADILAHQLGLSTDVYDEQYYGPAFDALDQNETCYVESPNVPVIIDKLVALGGSTVALPDQDQAYEDYQAMRAAWDAEAATEAPSTGKTKTK